MADKHLRLRPYEKTWVAKVRRSNARRVLLVGPTGSGKTVVAAHMIQRLIRDGLRVLFLAHRQELIDQAVSRLRERGVPPSAIGIIMAGRVEARDAPVQVASIDTLIRRELPPADVVFVDEAHHAAAKKYRTIIDAYPGAKVFGLTATPTRLDGKPLADVFDELVEGPTVSVLIAQGFLANPRVFGPPDAVDLSGVRTRGGDFDARELGKRMNQKGLVGSITQHWLKHANGLRTVVYAASIPHARAIARRFVREGVSAKVLTGETPTDDRRKMLADLAAGDLLVVVNYGVLAEGWDCPEVACCVMARPTQSEVLVRQWAGRIMRRKPRGLRPIVLDHANNCATHGLPGEDREWSLTEERTKVSHGQVRTRECPECGSRCSVGCRVCPNCDHEFWGKREDPPEDARKYLVEIRQSKRERAIELIRGGMTAPTVAMDLGVGATTVYAWARAAGLKLVDPKRKDDATRDLALQLTREGMSWRAVGKKLGLCPTTVSGWSRRAGIRAVYPKRKDDERGIAIELIHEGMSAQAIARKLGVHRETVRRWGRATGIQIARAEG